mgnify:CR=1 FL=1
MYEHAIPHVPDRRLWKQLQAKDAIIESANKRIKEVDTKVHNICDRLRKAHHHMEGFQIKLQDTIHFNRKQRMIDDDLQASLNTQVEIKKMRIATFEDDKEDMTQRYQQVTDKYEHV